MCMFCKNMDNIKTVYIDWLDEVLKEVPDLPLHSIVNQQDMKRTTTSMDINSQIAAEEALKYRIPMKHYLRTFRVCFVSHILRRVIPLTNKECVERFNISGKDTMVKYLAQILLEEGITEIPDLTGLNHHILLDIVNSPTLPDELVPAFESAAQGFTNESEEDRNKEREFTKLLESMEIKGDTPKH
jgi:hypothetical protein